MLGRLVLFASSYIKLVWMDLVIETEVCPLKEDRHGTPFLRALRPTLNHPALDLLLPPPLLRLRLQYPHQILPRLGPAQLARQ